jgi:signal transduction histidine kinase
LNIREEELKSTLEGMSESVYVFDKNGVLVTTNQQKNKDYFIERSCDALIGKAYQEIFADTFIQKLDKAIRVACTTQMKHEFEYIVKREGEEKAPDHYKICVLARKDISGNFAGITMITRNVTASKRLKEQNTALEKVNEELDHFVYSASHDLRAPLASTMGLINITRISDDLQEKTNYLNLMESSLQKMDRYIHDITDYSRNARLAIELEKIEFDELINDIIQTLSYHENTSKIDFLVKTEDTIPFYSDYSRLNIIFRNVISNAVKYHDLTRPHPYLSIDIKITKQEGIFRFEDNGIGIEEKYIDKIFDMFYKASPESFGSGLGLYIVKETMNRLKGNIKVESTLGQGSVFTITLPNHTEKLP